MNLKTSTWIGGVIGLCLIATITHAEEKVKPKTMPQAISLPQVSGRFQIINGTPEMTRNIMLLDTQTGDTWVVCEHKTDPNKVNQDLNYLDLGKTGNAWCFMPKDFMSKGHYDAEFKELKEYLIEDSGWKEYLIKNRQSSQTQIEQGLPTLDKIPTDGPWGFKERK